MVAKAEATSSGIGFCGLLTVAFIVLKLTGYIDWSWLWILSPLWIPIAIGIGIVLIVFIGWVTLELLRK